MGFEPIRKVLSLIALLGGALALGGCSLLIHTFADPVAEAQVKRLKLPTSRAEGFSECLDKPKGVCVQGLSLSRTLASPYKAPARTLDTKTVLRGDLLDQSGKRLPMPPQESRVGVTDEAFRRLQVGAVAAARAAGVLDHPAQRTLNDIFNATRASRADAPYATPSEQDRSKVIVIDVASFIDYAEKIEEATALDGWGALEEQLRVSRASEDEQARLTYINAYFKAYFRNGRFYSVKMNGKDLKKKIADRLADALPAVPETSYEDLARKLFDEFDFDSDGQLILGKVAAEGFVTRGGQDIKMPSVEAELDLASGKSKVTKLDTTATAADLVRVLLHAIYDAHDRLPGVANATGNSKTLSKIELGMNDRATTKVDARNKIGLGTNDPETTKVDEGEFEEIENRSARVEQVVSAGVGRLVRGLGVVALNNEAIAAAIETAVGVAARKHTEKVLWCWAACELNASPGGSRSMMALPDVTAVDVRIKGANQRGIMTRFLG